MPEPISTISPRFAPPANPILALTPEPETLTLDEWVEAILARPKGQSMAKAAMELTKPKDMPPEELLAILMAQEVKELPASNPMRKKPNQSFGIHRRPSTYPKHRDTLLPIIKANPGTTTRKIADQLEMGVKTILDIVKKMEDEGLVRREAKARNQAWEIFAVEQEQ